MKTFNITDQAIYLPAVNSPFAKDVCKPLPEGRRFPASIDVKDLNFWEPNKLFYYPHILHSVGAHKFGDWPNNAVTRTDVNQVQIIGDSGGYQLGTGAIKGYSDLKKGIAAESAKVIWSKAHSLRNWVMTWSETFTSAAMTLDVPLWATTPKSQSPFAKCDHAQIMDMNQQSIDFIKFYGQPGSKWINVIHGLDLHSTKVWWDRFKADKFSGWAMAGGAGTRGGLYQMLSTLLMMRDDGGFDASTEYLQVLGVSTPKWAVVLTELQKQLRKHSPALQVTFDSSSPFQEGMRYEVACIPPTYGSNESDWVIGTDKSIQGHKYVGSNTLFKYDASPLGKIMDMGHLNCKGNANSKTNFDSLSRLMLVNHNVWVYLDAFERANQAVRSSDKLDLVPSSFLEILDIVQEAFGEADWQSFLLKHKAQLDKFEKSDYDQAAA